MMLRKTERERKREKEPKLEINPGFVWFQTNLNNTEQIRENESNLRKTKQQIQDKLYILVVFTQHYNVITNINS